MKLVRPLKRNLCSQKFGENKVSFYKDIGMAGHNGIDWSADDGDEIRWECTDCEGIVLDNHIDRYGGLGVKVLSQDTDGNFKHLFWHLKDFSCKPGQVLSTGDLIGHADNTGRSTGTHLHRGLKRVEKNKYGIWRNMDGSNGYYGGINIEPYIIENIYVKDYLNQLGEQLSWIQQMVDKIRKLIASLK